jgi:NADH:ubiquinone oxidoreductase subunit F (NADH-binding)
MERILTKNIGKADSQDISVYLADGGYQALKKALSMNPEEIISEVKKSGLLGRGGAAFPVALKWMSTRSENVYPKYVVCNADEGEPGTFKDRIILKQDPHSLIEALIIAGYAVGAQEGYIYIRGEYYREIEAVEQAIGQTREQGYLGDNILNSGFSFNVMTYKGAGAYVCGEETSLLQSMAGMRGTPDCLPRPPFPAQKGFMDKPTTVNNVETLANIPHIINRGAEWYAGIGSPESPGPKLFCLSGHVNKPGLYELPLGITLRELIEDYGGGVKGEFKVALTGGVSSSLIPDLDIKLDYKSVVLAGGMLGSASVIVMNQDTNMINVAKNTIDFFAHESCGKCSICREGTRRAREILKRLYHKEGKANDIALLQELGVVMFDTACCGLGQSAMNLTGSAIKLFRKEFEEGVMS